MNETQLTYKDSGVDISEGNAFVDDIKPIVQKTVRPGVLNGLGGFGALFKLPLHEYKQPILVSSTDGVGTKVKIAHMLDNHNTIGIDLVAMCVNDIIVQGAEPLFFLDYFATSKLERNMAKDIISGIGRGCEIANVALIGGETAEMPGTYHQRDYDLAGFCVGIVDQAKLIDGQKVLPGDKLLGIASSGPHANGYSLIRKILSAKNINLSIDFEEKTLGETLLEPTRIYIRSLLTLFTHIEVKSLAHITGGGILENIPRVLPPHCQAIIKKESWPMPSIFKWLQQQGNITEMEMLRTFNCGVGMVVCVAENDAQKASQVLQELGEQVWEIGHIATHSDYKPRVLIQ